ncbi:Shedu anti-phage system protein SduA domain-containing protein [Streptomyces sp. NBC_01306]|uniref:Shedu anti-phage system protein SduA domain-containing protein n=1 Tax=Streptomyces sp. NBC_01306 TaxID=2903819 RepID=UPI00224D603C|nr:Shedu anti-phage system protein SduA domain-containing protein [Streptomyces sp. NBC_01306]MCX4725985.1 DUF4263 domain-containing protein [Streptomyces sp. NBC_01306]
MQLQLATYPKKLGDNGYDFENPTQKWRCENSEIERLVAFLSDDVRATGRYRIVDAASASTAMLTLLENGDVDPAALGAALSEHRDLSAVIAALTATTAGLSAAEAAVIARRRAVLNELKTLAVREGVTETDMQKAMERHHWLFGGQYVGVAHRQSLTMLDRHDIPLVGANGSLHIVELKGSNIESLVKKYRSHHIVGSEVHEATSQVMNYLKHLDQQGASMEQTFRNNHGVEYDTSRLCGTVVMGHSRFVPGVGRKIIDQTLRTFNSHLSRVEVMTYEDVLDRAEMALRFEESTADDQ